MYILAPKFTFTLNYKYFQPQVPCLCPMITTQNFREIADSNRLLMLQTIFGQTIFQPFKDKK